MKIKVVELRPNGCHRIHSLDIIAGSLDCDNFIQLVKRSIGISASRQIRLIRDSDKTEISLSDDVNLKTLVLQENESFTLDVIQRTSRVVKRPAGDPEKEVVTPRRRQGDDVAGGQGEIQEAPVPDTYDAIAMTPRDQDSNAVTSEGGQSIGGTEQDFEANFDGPGGVPLEFQVGRNCEGGVEDDLDASCNEMEVLTGQNVTTDQQHLDTEAESQCEIEGIILADANFSSQKLPTILKSGYFDQRVYVNCFFGQENVRINAIFDTGCVCNVMSTSCARRLGITADAVNVAIRVGQESRESAGLRNPCIFQLPVKFEPNLVVHLNVILIEALKEDLVLGLQFIRKYNCIMHFGRRVVLIKEESGKETVVPFLIAARVPVVGEEELRPVVFEEQQ